jgi:hypothetical protein
LVPDGQRPAFVRAGDAFSTSSLIVADTDAGNERSLAVASRAGRVSFAERSLDNRPFGRPGLRTAA